MSKTLIVLFVTGLFFPVTGQIYHDHIQEGIGFHEQNTQSDLPNLMQKARSLSSQGAYQAAILVYQDILKLDPQNEAAHLELGEIALKTKNWAYSILMLSELAALNPYDVKTRRLLMEIYHTFEEYTKELKIVHELVKLQPDDIDLLNRLANLYRSHDMYTDQAEVLETLIKLQPDKFSYYWQLSEIYNKQYNLRKEISTYEKLLTLQPDNPAILKRLARKYGETGNYGKQIKYYTKIHDLENNSLAWKKILFETYDKALRSYDLTFDIPEARQNCKEYLHEVDMDQNALRVSEGLASAVKPIVNFSSNWRRYDFAGKTDHLENRFSLDLLGPVMGSKISFDNRYIFVKQKHNLSQTENFEPIQTEQSQLYSGKIRWNQKFSKINFHVDAGILKPVSGVANKEAHFITAAGLTITAIEKLSLNATYDFNYLTVNPITIGENINHHQFELQVIYSIKDNLHLNTSYKQDQLSDGNNGRNFVLGAEYDIIKTLFKTNNLEAIQPLGYDNTGTQFSIGLFYYFLDYNTESPIYPTVINEHQLNLNLRAEKQFIQSFIGRLEAFIGTNNQNNWIWGYYLAVEKHLTWRLNLLIEWDHFISPYSYDNIRYINIEHGIRFGFISRF